MNEILKTTDYDIFKDFSSNREVDPKHVAQLVRNIRTKNLLNINPIIVNQEMYIIDGQHRLEAAKELQLEIYYLISNKITRHDISKLNSNQKNWKTMDYINFYTIEKLPAFIELSKFLNHYPHLSISAAVALCCSTLSRNTKEIKEGILDVENIKFAYEVAEQIKEIYQKYQHDFIYDSRFPLGIAKAFKEKNFNIDVFYAKIDENPRSFVKCSTIEESSDMIKEIYNKNLSKNKILLS